MVREEEFSLSLPLLALADNVDLCVEAVSDLRRFSHKNLRSMVGWRGWLLRCLPAEYRKEANPQIIFLIKYEDYSS